MWLGSQRVKVFFIKTRLQHKCFLGNITKEQLRTAIPLKGCFNNYTKYIHYKIQNIVQQILWISRTKFELVFLENLFGKLGVAFFCWKYYPDNPTYRNKTSLTEASIKAERIESTKWINWIERSFASNYFIFSFFFPIYCPLRKNWFDVATTQMYIFIFFVGGGVLLRMLFSG